ncbi:MAG: 2-oxoglutarate dehydrogenase E1 component [Pelagibacteraceae bacterium]|nr:2-oxoglutarate dehydrogenase E1 component [Pelagibacteraceae bacterium]PPR51427.1 MAG: 2-oxoglutarate dehydrogenase E1 component [Alphaproteobacteria bacterium MarineAlpha5_Bin10]|tara:strand:+ start:12039 stop:14945 length:2907 start_codon:yes stop_codon:yes gene_type:complete
MKNKDTFLSGANAPYVAELFFKYQQNKQSVDSSWVSFFQSLNEDEISVISDFRGPKWKKRKTKIIEDLDYSGIKKVVPQIEADSFKQSTLDSIRALRLIRAYRINGHLIAKLDPLDMLKRNHHTELDYKTYGFTENDLDRLIFIDGSLGLESSSLRNIINVLQETYSGSIGVEFLHIQDPEQKQWIQKRIEEPRNKTQFTELGKKFIHERIMQAESFEKYLDKKFLGTKRYGLEGGESTIPGLEQIVKQACLAGIQEIEIGTAHRGRLTILTTLFEVPYREIMSKFQGNLNDPNEVLGTGDVKYHLGVSTDRQFEGKKIHLTLSPNPSHLEAVNPVVVGKVRAKQTISNDKTNDKIMGLLIHGDAAMAGQGIVAETFAMSQLRGFRTGGTVHFVINNQIGFTTMPVYGRSAPYCTEIAKMVQAPIFHVNGDDPESVVHASRIATEYKIKFKQDVVIDMFCYRRSGHNEIDEPSFTQPLMYKKIKSHPTTLKIYQKKLISNKTINENEIKNIGIDFEKFLDKEFLTAPAHKINKADWLEGKWSGFSTATFDARRGKTSVKKEKLEKIGKIINTIPRDFNVHEKIRKLFEKRLKSIDLGKEIDWATAEALAFATLLEENYGVRLSGQDSGRGTFSQRHAVLYDQETESRFVPLRHFLSSQGLFEIIDSFLSELGVLGFEYGYSQADPKTLVIWEAQFGDFANNAQVIIDQFITASERKWLRMSGITLLLPHGHEGQGPEHTSSRLERFLQMCAEDNMQIVNCTTPANYFHVLRRQIHRNFRKPLIIMTPKSPLRNKNNISSIDEFIEDSSFHRTLGENLENQNIDEISRVIICSGKIYFDLIEEREKTKSKNVYIIRLEQLYPFPYEPLTLELKKFKKVEVVWCQEEPKNMGPWGFVSSRINNLLKKIQDNNQKLYFIGRRASAVPATGSYERHLSNQKNITRLAIKAKIEEIDSMWEGVSLRQYKLPIE